MALMSTYIAGGLIVQMPKAIASVTMASVTMASVSTYNFRAGYVQWPKSHGFGDHGYGDHGFDEYVHCRGLGRTNVQSHGFGDHGFGDHGFGDHGFGDHGFGDYGFGDHGYGDPMDSVSRGEHRDSSPSPSARSIGLDSVEMSLARSIGLDSVDLSSLPTSEQASRVATPIIGSREVTPVGSVIAQPRILSHTSSPFLGLPRHLSQSKRSTSRYLATHVENEGSDTDSTPTAELTPISPNRMLQEGKGDAAKFHAKKRTPRRSASAKRHQLAMTKLVFPPSWQGLHVLAVDDNAINRRVLGKMLKQMGFEVTVACDGQEAVQKVAESVPTQAKSNVAKFDIILMDVQMPILDGLAATKQIRELDSLYAAEVPICGLTANNSQEMMHQCEKAGMSGFLSKPILRDKMMAELGRLLGTDNEHGLDAIATTLPH
eukprot:g52294.t1